MNRTLLALFLSAGLLLSCSGSESPPDNLIEEETYIDLLVELQLLETYRSGVPDSVAADTLRAAIFRKHGVQPEAFRRSHRYYRQNLEEQKERIDEAIERLRRDQVEEPADAESAQESDQR